MVFYDSWTWIEHEDKLSKKINTFGRIEKNLREVYLENCTT